MKLSTSERFLCKSRIFQRIHSLRASIIAVSIIATSATADSASEADIAGTYEGIGPYHSSEMIISKEQGHLRVFLKGGARDNSEAAAADCEAVVKGELVNGVLRGQLIPFEGEVTSLDTRDIQRINSQVLIFFDKNTAIVKGEFAYCGLQNALSGKYKKPPSVYGVSRAASRP